MKFKHKIKKVAHAWHGWPLYNRILLTLGVVVVVMAGLSILMPKTVEFSYSGKNCARQLTLFPSAMKQTSESGYSVEFEHKVMIGSLPIASFGTCFVPLTVPTPGETTVSLSLLDTGIVMKRYVLRVNQPAVADTAGFIGQTLPVTRPITIPLDQPDDIFHYAVNIGKKSAACEHRDTALHCDILPLDLAQGKTYEASLSRSFDNQSPAILGSGKIITLKALKLKDATISDNKTIYTKPKSLSFEYDKELIAAEGELKLKDDEKWQTVAAAVTIQGKKVVFTPETALKRAATFKLTIQKAEAPDGSALADPYQIDFKVSGGPKVKSVSAPGSGIGQNEQIIITFDQPISKKTDITKLAHISGVTGTVRKQSDRQLVFTLQNAPLCRGVTLIIDKGVKSGSNDEASSKEWRFNSRVICGTSAVIGHSIKDRPIVAYYFGSGSKTILFTGGIHGSEPSGYSTMQALVEYLKVNAYNLPANKRVVVVPNTNPDGIAAGSRNNARNVNVDRNFPTANWSKSIETSSGTLPKGGGTHPGSEPEAKALLSISRQLKPRLAVSYHAQGSLVGANKFADSVKIGDIYASTVGYGTMYYNAEEVMGYKITGEYEDWLGEELGVPAILIELPTAAGNYLTSQLTAILKMIAV